MNQYNRNCLNILECKHNETYRNDTKKCLHFVALAKKCPSPLSLRSSFEGLLRDLDHNINGLIGACTTKLTRNKRGSEVVPGRGLEPPWIAPRGPKPRASTNFATPACFKFTVKSAK